MKISYVAPRIDTQKITRNELVKTLNEIKINKKLVASDDGVHAADGFWQNCMTLLFSRAK